MTCRCVSAYLGWGSHGQERYTVPSSWKTLREPQPAMQLCNRKYCLTLHRSQNIHFKGTEKAHAVQIPNWNINKDVYNSYGGAWAAKRMICCCCTLSFFYIIVSSLEMKKWLMVQNDHMLSGPGESWEKMRNERDREKRKTSLFPGLSKLCSSLGKAASDFKRDFCGSRQTKVSTPAQETHQEWLYEFLIS